MPKSFLRLTAVSACLLSIAYTTTSFAIPEGYVSAVMADLDEFNSGEFVTPEDKSWVFSAETENDGTASLSDFESFIKTKFRGTYILFARLPDWKKEEIWKKYVSTGDLGGIRSSIFSFRKGKKSRAKPALSNLPLDF